MSFPLEIDIAIEAGDWPQDAEVLAQKALRAAAGASGKPLAGPAEISMLLTDDAAQRALNRDWRGKDAPTNVLSFPQIDPADPVAGLLGDISLAYETVARESEAMNRGFEAHFIHLVIHGYLHLIGFDHDSRKEALVMEAIETDIMATLGYPDPYEGEEPE